MKEMYNYYELFKNIDLNPSYIYDYFISSNSDYFYNFNIIKNHCDSYINSLAKGFVFSFKRSLNVIYEVLPEFKLYNIISENLRLAEKFLYNIDNFYLYKLEFSTFRFYLRQSIEAFVQLFNLMEEDIVMHKSSVNTNYYMLNKLYSQNDLPEELESFRKQLSYSNFYSKNEKFGKIISDVYKNNPKLTRPTHIDVSSNFYIARQNLDFKFDNFKNRDVLVSDKYIFENYGDFHKNYKSFIGKLNKIYSRECKFVHVSFDNDDLFDFSHDVVKTFHNLNNKLEDLTYIFYSILVYSCNLFYILFDIDKNEEFADTLRQKINYLKYITDYNSEDTLEALSNKKSYCKENNITALNVSAKIDFLKL